MSSNVSHAVAASSSTHSSLHFPTNTHTQVDQPNVDFSLTTVSFSASAHNVTDLVNVASPDAPT